MKFAKLGVLGSCGRALVLGAWCLVLEGVMYVLGYDIE